MCNAYKVERHNAHGTEWSAGFRAFAKYRYGLNNVTEDIDETQKYDFISYYHVLEHVQYPQNHLLKCRELLKDDGYLYLSVPLFLGNLENEDGTPLDNFEHHYHINHVNCFTHQSFANILRLTGWEPIKQEHVYGWTVLCKKVDPVIDIVKEDYLKVQDILTRQKQAIKHMTERQFDEAEKLYPEYPDLYIYRSMTSDLMKDINAQMPIVAKGLELMPGNRKILSHMGRILFQWDENTHKDHKYSNNIKQAEEIFTSLVQRFPGSDDCMYFLGIIAMKYKQDYDEAIHWFGRCVDINPNRFMDCGQLICVAFKSKYEKEMRAS
jgi:tetratricopeptide (TPR) repeat protein